MSDRADDFYEAGRDDRILSLEQRQYQTDENISSILNILLQVSDRLDGITVRLNRVTELQQDNAEQIAQLWAIVQAQTGNGHGG